MIEIPGYRILRTLGRGGMATVHLALQESVRREVALKVMSPALSGDPDFTARFLREARIAASLRHPNVVQVHDVGVSGEHPFIAMEYLPGGPLLARGAAPRDPAFALRALREIAGALDYAHRRGVVHRDIKPDNILLREDGSAVLTDFGIARANDGSGLTRTGAIFGTPHYMSPEQARGRPVDGRSDLYSLGIVGYQLLTGRVPFDADDALAVGIMHVNATPPPLPAALAALQPLFDRWLAKDPAQRFADGRALAEAIAAIEAGRPPAPADAAGPHTLPPPARGRREPRLDPSDDATGLRALRAERGAPRARAARPQRPRSGAGWRWGVLLAVALLVALAALLWTQQERLRALLPQTEIARQLADAEALLGGDTLAVEDARRALQLYRAVLAKDPEHLAAREGLRRLAARVQAAVVAAAEAPDSGPTDTLQALRALAVDLALPPAALAPLEARLRDGSAQERALAALYARARSALDAGRIDGDGDAAIPLFREMLARDPGNAVARRGLDDALSRRLAEAAGRIAAGDETGALAIVEAVAAAEPGHPGLPQVRGQLAELRQARETLIEARLSEARRALAAGRLVAPPEDNARTHFRAVLQQSPTRVEASEGLRQIAQALAQQAQRAAADFEFAEAEALLAEARATDAAHPAIAAATQRIAEARRAQSQAGRSLSPQLAAQRDELLRRGREAMSRGALLLPPGESAYDLLRAARDLDPEHAATREALAGLPGLARSGFETALGERRVQAALGLLDAYETLAPTAVELPSMRQRLAAALVGVAEERLGEGDLAAAQTAFDGARSLDPQHAALPSLQARLEAAAAGAR